MPERDAEPYVGPRPFEKEDSQRFFGRHREANALISLIIAHPVVLLYAQSGAGKTSLLNAEVLPVLESRGFEVFSGARVRGELPPEVAAEVKNVYAYNALLSLNRSSTSTTAELKDLSIKDYLAARPRPPQREGISPLRVLLFDQFEEIFTSSVNRWQHRGEFFDLVGDALDADPLLRVVFSMREEFVASIDPYARKLPDSMDTRLRLEPLREDAALLAVTEPLGGTGRKFKPEAAKRLVDNLLKVPIRSIGGVVDVSGEFVEPLHLQLVCTQLWGSLDKNVTLIDERYIQDYGDVDDALAAYYERCVKQVAEEANVKEGTVRNWIERALITSDGARGIVPMGEESTAGLDNRVVAALEKRYLIRTEMRGSKPWYELTHDRFVGPIRDSNKRWRNALGVGSATKRQELEAVAESWVRANKPPSQLLSGSELSRAASWLLSGEAEELGASDALKELVQASQLAQVKKKRNREMAIFAGIVTVVIVVAINLAMGLRSEADARRHLEDAISIVRGQAASELAPQPGKEFDALAFGIKAVGPRLAPPEPPAEGMPGLFAALRSVVGRRLPTQVDPPTEAVKGLRAALAAVGEGTWLRGNTAQVNEVWFLEHDTRALAISKDDACVWEAATGRRLFPCIRSAQEGSWLHASPNRKWIFNQPISQSRSDQKTAEIWNIATGKPAFQDQLKGISSIQFSDDGNNVLAASAESGARILDLASGVFGPPIDNLPDDKVASKAISAAGTLVASVDADGEGQLWSGRTGKPIALLPRREKLGRPSLSFATFSPDPSRLLIASLYAEKQQTVVSTWAVSDAQAVRELATIKFPSSSFASVAIQFSPDAKQLIVLGLGPAQVWDSATGAAIGTFDLPPAITSQLWDGGRIFGMRNDSASAVVYLFDAFRGTKLIEGFSVPVSVVAADISADLGRIMTLNQANAIKVLDMKQTALRNDNLSGATVFRAACERIRYQPEFEDAELKSMCEKAAGSVAAR